MAQLVGAPASDAFGIVSLRLGQVILILKTSIMKQFVSGT